jgi:hypothetical protein
MSDSLDLTPKEKLQVALMKDPKRAFHLNLTRKVPSLIVSIGFMIGSYTDGNRIMAAMGYGILLYMIVQGIFHSRRGMESAKQIITKYEARINEKTSAP